MRVQHGHIHLQISAAGLLRLQNVVQLFDLLKKIQEGILICLALKLMRALRETAPQWQADDMTTKHYLLFLSLGGGRTNQKWRGITEEPCSVK